MEIRNSVFISNSYIRVTVNSVTISVTDVVDTESVNTLRVLEGVTHIQALLNMSVPQ